MNHLPVVYRMVVMKKRSLVKTTGTRKRPCEKQATSAEQPATKQIKLRNKKVTSTNNVIDDTKQANVTITMIGKKELSGDTGSSDGKKITVLENILLNPKESNVLNTSAIVTRSSALKQDTQLYDVNDANNTDLAGAFTTSADKIVPENNAQVQANDLYNYDDDLDFACNAADETQLSNITEEPMLCDNDNTSQTHSADQSNQGHWYKFVSVNGISIEFQKITSSTINSCIMAGTARDRNG